MNLNDESDCDFIVSKQFYTKKQQLYTILNNESVLLIIIMEIIDLIYKSLINLQLINESPVRLL